MTFTRTHHQRINHLLSQFNPDFLYQNNILFGGGTRIALELNEFRESVDIDLFCIGTDAYRAARSTITNVSFGELVKEGCEIERFAGREIRADRDAIRTLLVGTDQPIKLEIVNFSNQHLLPGEVNTLFPIACVSRVGCFATKLTANADRYNDHIKDILDLCMMRREWGNIPEKAWEIACEEYGQRTISSALGRALRKLHQNEKAKVEAVDSLRVGPALANEIIDEQSNVWLEELMEKGLVE